jgi:hypothetical protein
MGLWSVLGMKTRVIVKLTTAWLALVALAACHSTQQSGQTVAQTQLALRDSLTLGGDGLPYEGGNADFAYVEWSPGYKCSGSDSVIGYRATLVDQSEIPDVCDPATVLTVGARSLQNVCLDYAAFGERIFQVTPWYASDPILPLAPTADHFNEILCTGSAPFGVDVVIERSAETQQRTGRIFILSNYNPGQAGGQPSNGAISSPPFGVIITPYFWVVDPFAVSLPSGSGASLIYSAPGFSLFIGDTSGSGPLSGQVAMTLNGIPYSFSVSCVWDKN